MKSTGSYVPFSRVRRLNPELLKQLEHHALELATTLDELLQACAGLMLGGSRDAGEGTIESTRRTNFADEMGGVCGPLSVIHRWRLNVPLGAPLAEVLGISRRARHSALPVQDGPGIGGCLDSNVIAFDVWHLPNQSVNGPGLVLRFEDEFEFSRPRRLGLQCSGLNVRVYGDARWLDGGEAEDWLDRYETVLEGLGRGLGAGAVELVGKRERERLLGQGGGAQVEQHEARDVLELIEQVAQRWPDRVAVRACGHALSYGGLVGRARRIAQGLREVGVRDNDRVGVLIERGTAQIEAVLGVLAAGAAYVALDVHAPGLRLSQQLADCGARFVLVQAPGRVEEGLAGVHELSVHALLQVRQGWYRKRSGGAQLAYVLYTSGSTGSPKGVAITQQGLLSSTLARRQAYARSPEVLLLLPGVFFDSSVAGLFWTLSSGGTLVLPAEAQVRDARQLGLLVRQQAVTHWLSVPSLYAAVLEAQPHALEGLRLVIVAGEACASSLVQQHHAQLGQASLYNEYGPTEATVWCTFAVLQPDQEVTIGHPVAGTRVDLMDPCARLAPQGARAQLWVGGAGLAQGYWGRPAETAARFLPHPLGDSGQRAYCSGDWGWRGRDGAIRFLGREDAQVKLNGYRVELSEVEAALGSHQAVQSAVVVVVRSQVLHGYTVCRAGMSVTGEQLREHLARHLPAYMVPATLTTLPALPLLPNGKVDRQALGRLRPQQEEQGRSAAGATEVALMHLWQDLLGLTQVGAQQDFFALGGHSLLAMRLIARVQRTFGVSLSFEDILNTPTIEAISSRIDELRFDPRASEVIAQIEHEGEGRYEPFEMTAIQSAYWLGRSKTFELGNVSTCSATEFEFNDLDLAHLEDCINHLIHRHDMLRAIVLPDGRMQILRAVPRLKIEVTDLSAISPEESQSVLARERDALSHLMLDLHTWPILKVKAYLLAGRTRIHFVTDLIISDAYSSRILGSELAMLYRNPGTDLPAIGIQFRDVARSAPALRNSPAYVAAQRYWQERIPQLPTAPQLPLAKSAADIVKPVFVRRIDRLEQGTWEALRNRALKFKLPPSAALCAAFSTVLAKWSESSHFTINMTTYARPQVHPDVDKLVGDFTSTMLLEVEVRDEPFLQRAIRLQQRIWRDLEHRHYSGVDLLRELRRHGHGTTRALMPVVFTSTLGAGPGVDESNAQSLFGDPLFGCGQTPQVCIDHQVSEDASGRLVFWWDPVEEMFPEGMIDDMFVAYRSLIHALAEDDAAWSATLRCALPAEAERQRVLANATGAEAPRGALHERWEMIARARPQRAALFTPTGTLTHGELESRSAALAALLVERGIAPGDRIGILMDKCADQIVATLATVRIGAAYVPLDPHQPVSRTDSILRRCGVKALLSDSSSREAQGCEIPIRLHVEQLEAWSGRTVPLPSVLASSVAYIIFTSGSTGEPKGVTVDHAAALNTICDVNRRFGVGADDCVLGISSLGFDLSVYDVFGILGIGGRLVLPRTADARDPSVWHELLNVHGVTIWNSVPALLDMLVTHMELREVPAIPQMRLILLSGDWIPLGLVPRARAFFPNARLISLGGATEAAIWSIYHEIEELQPEWSSVPYGKPLSNQSFHILDQHLEPRPDWVSGELYIEGSGLAVGYWGDEAQSRERFIKHPLSGSRLYRTGDLARYRPGGVIEFLGRTDAQVKIRGHRIELGEIESHLARHPDVARALVTSLGERERKRLVAYVVACDSDAPPLVEALRTYLAGFVPSYMIPSSITLLEEFPLSSNGKIDMARLKPPELDADQGKETFKSDQEVGLLMDIWKDQLGLSEVGEDHDFFALGGESLAALRLTERMSRVLGVELPLSLLFEAPTIRGIVNRIAGFKRKFVNESDMLPSVTPDLDSLLQPFRLTNVQQAYWVGRQAAFALGNVSTSAYMEFDSPRDTLDLSRLANSVDMLVQRHPMLRAVVRSDAMQMVLPASDVAKFRIVLNDVSNGDSSESALIADVRARLQNGVMDLTHWPAFRIELTRMKEKDRLHVALDMVVADALSLRILLSELVAVYLRGPEALAPAAQLSFRDYVMALRQVQDGPLYAASKQYWLSRIDTLPGPPDLPLIAEPEALERPIFARRSFQLAEADWIRLKANCAQAKLTPTAVVCASLCERLAAWAGRRFTLNLTTYSRLPIHPDVQKIVGDFTSVSLLEINIESESFLERAKAVQRRLWEDLQYRHFDGIEVMRLIRRRKGDSTSAVMPVVFTSTLGIPYTDDEREAVAVLGEAIENNGQTPQVWIDVQAVEIPDGMAVRCDAIDSLFPEGMLDELMEGFANMVLALAGDALAWDGLPTFGAKANEPASLRASAEETGLQPAVAQDHHELVRFQLSEHGLRRDLQASTEWHGSPYGSLAAAWNKRRSARTFAPISVHQRALARWLECLRRVVTADSPLPKYRYPSAGALYPVQAYVWVAPDRCDGVEPGAYYYDPLQHALCRVGSVLYEKATFGEFNRIPCEQAALAIVLVSDLRAIEPIYGANSRDFCLLEAGAMLQLLSCEASSQDLVACPTGGVDHERVHKAFGLGDKFAVLHSLLVGVDERSGLAFDRNQDPAVISSASTAAQTEGVSPEFVKISELLVELWRETLGLQAMKDTAHCFDLGATSIDVLRVHAKLVERLERDIPVVAMFEFPTVAALASYICSDEGTSLTSGPNRRQMLRRRRALRSRMDT